MSSLLVDNENIIPVYLEALLSLSSCSKCTVFRELEILVGINNRQLLIMHINLCCNN